MKHIPFLLVYSRIVIAVLIGLITVMNIGNTPVLIVILMTIGLITDIFDGIIVHRLGVAPEKLRVWDSNVDLFFWIVVIFSVFYLNIPFIQQNYLPVLAIVILEAIAYGFGYLKFKLPVATHSYMAKLWTLTLFAFLVDLAIHSNSNLLFKISAVFGIVSWLEIILIIALLKKWTTDIPSVFSIRWINKA